MSPEIITTRFAGQTHCPICGKPDAEHSFAEGYECAKAEEAERLATVCPTCGKTIAQHAPGEVHACALTSPCPACGRPFGQHSVEDHLACQKQRQKGDG